MAVDVISPPTNTFQLSLLSYTLVWTGTPSGTFTVEACNDAQFDPNGAYIAGTGSWDTLTLSVTVVATGAPGTALINLSQLGFAFCRLHYVAGTSPGTGNLTVTVAGKVA
jgi:hypothetical protein